MLPGHRQINLIKLHPWSRDKAEFRTVKLLSINKYACFFQTLTLIVTLLIISAYCYREIL